MIVYIHHIKMLSIGVVLFLQHLHKLLYLMHRFLCCQSLSPHQDILGNSLPLQNRIQQFFYLVSLPFFSLNDQYFWLRRRHHQQHLNPGLQLSLVSFWSNQHCLCCHCCFYQSCNIHIRYFQ